MTIYNRTIVVHGSEDLPCYIWNAFSDGSRDIRDVDVSVQRRGVGGESSERWYCAHVWAAVGAVEAVTWRAGLFIGLGCGRSDRAVIYADTLAITA